MPRKRARQSGQSGGLRPPAKRTRSSRDALQSGDNAVASSEENSANHLTDQPVETSPIENNKLVSKRPITPEVHTQLADKSSSELSSVPTSIGSTPAGLVSPNKSKIQPGIVHKSPTRRSERTRKRSARAVENATAEPALKKRRVSGTENSQSQAVPKLLGDVSTDDSSSTQDNLTAERSRRSSTTVGLADSIIGVLPSVEETPEPHLSHNDYEAEVQPPVAHEEPEIKANRKRKATILDESAVTPNNTKRSRLSTDEGYKSKSPASAVPQQLHEAEDLGQSNTPKKAKSARERRYDAKLEARRTSNVVETPPKSAKKRAVAYGAEGQPPTVPPAESTRRSGRNINRGGAKTNKGTAGNGKGRGSKARGKGRDDDSPEPPLPKKPQSQEDILTIKHIKARQAELRRFFHTVGSQQSEMLDIISSRDLARLIKKAKAHKLVPEYEELVADLEATQAEAEELARNRYAEQLEAENRRYEAEREAIERRCQITIKDLQDEYTKGAQGDLMLFRRAVAAAYDETGTQDGSEIGYIPHYHEFPEPDAKLRGFTSNRITDEKPFKHHPLTYDDEARRDVLDDDVGPIIQAFARKNAERRAEEERKKTQTMDALSEEAGKQLKDMNTQPAEKPAQTEDRNSWALSCLADVSEWKSRQDSHKPQVYTPPEDRDHFPRDVPAYEKFSNYGPALPPPSSLSQLPAESATPMQRVTVSKPQPTQGTRRSLRNLQPNGPLNQPQSYYPPTTHGTPAPSTPAAPSGVGPVIAPAPPKLAPGPSTPSGLHPRPPSLDTRPPAPHSEGPSPPQQALTFPQPPPVHGLPPLQPRHASHTSLPPPPPPYSAYPQQFSPTYPSQPYPPPSVHHAATAPTAPNHVPPPPSPYHQQQPPPSSSPYSQQPPQPYHPYSHPLPPPPPSSSQKQQQQQQYSFLPPQQGPTPPQFSPTLPRPHSRSRSHVSSPGQNLDPFRPSNLNRNGFHSRSSSIQFNPQPQAQPQQQPPGPPPPAPGHSRTPSHGHGHSHSHSQSHNINHNLGLGINTNIPPQTQGQAQPQAQSQPPSITTSSPVVTTTTTTKSRAKSKGRQSVTFVNQTLATRKAAAEHAAREEADRAAEKKERREKERDRADKADPDGKGRKLAPKM